MSETRRIISRLTLDLGILAQLLTPEPSSAHQWASNSPRTSCGSTARRPMSWTSWQPSYKSEPGNQLVHGPATYIMNTHSQSSMTKDPTPSIYGQPWNIWLWWPKGSALQRCIGRPLQKATSPWLGNNQPMEYIETKTENQAKWGNREMHSKWRNKVKHEKN